MRAKSRKVSIGKVVYMKRIIRSIIAVALLSIIFGCSLCGCSSLNYEDSSDYKQLLEKYDELENKYEEIAKYEELYNEAEGNYENLLDEFDSVTSYYEELCDVYGYLTYDDVYDTSPKNYYSKNIRHEDWLCEFFNKNTQYYSSNYDASIESCKNCCDDEEWRWYFLDEKTGIFHEPYAGEECLDIGTKNFKTPNRNYRSVKYSSAIKANYTPCSKCITE